LGVNLWWKSVWCLHMKTIICWIVQMMFYVHFYLFFNIYVFCLYIYQKNLLYDLHYNLWLLLLLLFSSYSWFLLWFSGTWMLLSSWCWVVLSWQFFFYILETYIVCYVIQIMFDVFKFLFIYFWKFWPFILSFCILILLFILIFFFFL